MDSADRAFRAAHRTTDRRTMKLLILALSLALNVAIVGAMWFRFDSPPLSVQDEAAVARLNSSDVTAARAPVRAHFDADDPLTFRNQPRAAGFPPHLLNAIIVAQVHQNTRAQIDANVFADGGHDYWSGNKFPSREELRTNMRIGAEASNLLNALPGPDYDQSARRKAESAHRFGSIAPEKIESLERLEKDYRDLIRSYRTGFFQRPSD